MFIENTTRYNNHTKTATCYFYEGNADFFVDSQYDLLFFFQSSMFPELVVTKEQLTSIVDIRISEKQLFDEFSKDTRYEIRRCLKNDNADIKIIYNPTDNDIEEYLEAHRNLYQRKKIKNTDFNYYKELYVKLRRTDNILFTKISIDKNISCYHTYLRDHDKARLLTSCSSMHAFDTHTKTLVGRLNRTLHFKDMLLCKQLGIKWLDMGGITDRDSDTITRFKKNFGGKTVIYYYGYVALSTKGQKVLARILNPSFQNMKKVLAKIHLLNFARFLFTQFQRDK